MIDNVLSCIIILSSNLLFVFISYILFCFLFYFILFYYIFYFMVRNIFKLCYFVLEMFGCKHCGANGCAIIVCLRSKHVCQDAKLVCQGAKHVCPLANKL